MSGRTIRQQAMLALLACLLASTVCARQAVSTSAPAPMEAAPAVDSASPSEASSLSDTTADASIPPPVSPDKPDKPTLPAGTRSGRDIYRLFYEGLAETDCSADRDSPRWRKHFASAPERLAQGDEHVLALFGYVVDAVRAASLPTEYALIPFVESGYDPAARSGAGPAGMWQFIKLTARDHDIVIHNGYDGRLSPVASTQAAVRYLKTLHGMFAGDWRLAAMAYNAGEYRLFGALRRSGQIARSVDHDRLPGLSSITRAYPRKIHTISCLLQQADDRQAWLQRLDRPVPILAAISLSRNTRLKTWAAKHGTSAKWLRQLNPVYRTGRVAATPDRPRPLLAPNMPAPGFADTSTPPATTAIIPHATARQLSDAPILAGTVGDASASIPQARTHVVRRGDSLWDIAHHYHVRLPALLKRNQLDSGSILQPGMVLKIDAN